MTLLLPLLVTLLVTLLQLLLQNLAQPFLKVEENLAQPFLKVEENLAQPFLKVEHLLLELQINLLLHYYSLLLLSFPSLGDLSCRLVPLLFFRFLVYLVLHFLQLLQSELDLSLYLVFLILLLLFLLIILVFLTLLCIFLEFYLLGLCSHTNLLINALLCYRMVGFRNLCSIHFLSPSFHIGCINRDFLLYRCNNSLSFHH